jgi:hypothetical protein
MQKGRVARPSCQFIRECIMPRLSLAFFSAGAAYGLVGMVWGAVMAAHEDFTLAPAHAHLNLLGWMALSIMGAFYALAGTRAPLRLGWINFALSNVGVIIGIPSLAMMLAGHKAATPFLQGGMGMVILGMVSFLVAILSLWTRGPGVVSPPPS